MLQLFRMDKEIFTSLGHRTPLIKLSRAGKLRGRSTRLQAQEDTKEIELIDCADNMPKPPNLIGKVACSHCWS